MCTRARTTMGKRAMSLMASSLMGPEALEEWKNTGMVSKEKRGPLGTYGAAAAACTSAAAAAQRSAIRPPSCREPRPPGSACVGAAQRY